MSGKPRINHQLAAQQYATTMPQKPNKSENGQKEKTDEKTSPSSKVGRKSWPPPRLKNVDRSTAQTREVTVNNITVKITEYQPKAKSSQDDHSSSSSESGSQSESSADMRSVETDSLSS